MSERDPFANDVLRRLVASNREYQNEHGHYIVPLAQRLLDTRAELERAEKVNAAAVQILAWQPVSDTARSSLHPQHRAALEQLAAALREAKQ
jgi:hypothetical protein